MKKVTYIENEVIPTKEGNPTSWTYIKEAPSKDYAGTKFRAVLVRCKCGVEKETTLTNIRNGKSHCCSDCARIGIAPKNKGTGSIETSYNAMIYEYRKGGEKRGYSFHLSMDEFKTLLHGNCVYCGTPPNQVYQKKCGKYTSGQPVTYNGVDRVVNTIGYTLDNCVSCCKMCNVAKHNHTEEEFLNWIKRVYNNLNLKEC